MQFSMSRIAAVLSLRGRSARCSAHCVIPPFAYFFILIFFAACAHAVVVRGHVTDATGKPLAGARVQLVQGGSVVAVVYADDKGHYEIRYSEAGRFTLLGSEMSYLPAIGEDFYGGATDVIDRDVVLAKDTVRQEITVTATGIPTPVPQLTAPIADIAGELLGTRLGVVDEMRQQPGVFMAQSGGTGNVTSLFLRGGNSTANLVLVDGVPAGDVGGVFDFGTVSSTAISQIEVLRGPDSAMYGTDAGAGVISITTPRGISLKPQVNYSGEAGTLHTWRNEVSAGGTLRPLDYYGAFSRLDASNAVPLDRYHSTTAAMNVGYNINGNTQARVTVHNGDSVEGVPGPWDFDGVSQNNRQGDQDLYSGVTLENRYKGDWHNLVRYGLVRKREQENEFSSPALGQAVVIRGANGYTTTGQNQLYTGNNYDQASNRDQLYYQSDYSSSKHLIVLFGFRYDNERGVFNDYDPAFAYVSHQHVQRTNFEYNLQLQGSFFDRLYYSAGGAIEKNHLYGIAGTPRLGLSYIPVRPSRGFFHGTRLRANAATGVQEPTLSLEENGLYEQATAAQRAQYHLAPPGAERSRTYDIGIDQNIWNQTLVLKAGYFHNVFDHQLEGVNGTTLNSVFGFNVPQVYEAYINSLAFRAQGAEVEVEWQPKSHILVRGGWTNLSTRVVQSFTSDALSPAQNTNPNFPNILIGNLSPLIGARPFRRPPNTGYFAAQYTRSKFSVAFKGAMASRSDDSTYLGGNDVNFGNSLLLPNHDLDFGYVKLDVGATYALPHHLTVFTQLENLTNDQHIGPIGYPGLPLTVRAGLKLKLFGD